MGRLTSTINGKEEAILTDPIVKLSNLLAARKMGTNASFQKACFLDSGPPVRCKRALSIPERYCLEVKLFPRDNVFLYPRLSWELSVF